MQQQILTDAPELYLEYGFEVTYVYQVIEYEPNPRFRQFGDSVSAA